MTHPCANEEVVLAAALAPPDAPIADEATAHMAECDSCRELFILATTLRDDRSAAIANAHVPSAGQTWWRAGIRARQEAAAAAARPITVATGLAAACLVGLLLSVTGALAWWLRASLAPAARVLLDANPSAWAMPTGMWLVVCVVALVATLAAPVVLYVATRED